MTIPTDQSPGNIPSSRKSNLCFPALHSTLIRNLMNTRTDFDALARCFNSFKDSDSWPGGFGGNFVFTGELLESDYASHDFTSKFVVCAPDNPEKIVGVCFANPMWNFSNGYYVELLGVDPAYQQTGLGKALLLRATQYALDQRAFLITLHTWGGNLKAMPLYKRQGYKWAPKTSVWMQSCIPQILWYPFFQGFFHDLTATWYDAYKPVIDQAPNLEFEDRMAIYEYFFEEDSQSLRVWADRLAGKISGFHLKTKNGTDLLLKATTPNSEAFIGIEEFPFTLQLENNGSTSLRFTMTVQSSKQIQLLETQDSYEFDLPPFSTETLSLKGKFLPDTEELDRNIHTHTFTDHSVEFVFAYQGRTGSSEFSVNVGKVPINAIKILPSPLNFTTIPDHQLTFPLTLRNNIGKEKTVNIRLTNGNNITFDEPIQSVTVSPYDTTAEFRMTIGSTPTTVDHIGVHLTTDAGEELSTSTIPICIFHESKTLSYEFEQQLFVENKHYRLSLYKKCQPGSNEVTLLDKLRRLKVKGQSIVLGYPFDNEGSEFFKLTLDHVIKEVPDGIWLFSSAISQKNPGIKVTRKFFIPNDLEPIQVSWQLDNMSSELKTNLGLQYSTYWRPQEQAFHNRVIPHQNGLMHIRFFGGFPVDMGKDPKDYEEGWQASQFAGGWIGWLFDPIQVNKTEIGRFYPRIDYKVPDLQPGDSYTSSSLYYVFTDSWQQVKKHWQDKYQQHPANELTFHPQTLSHKDFGLFSVDGNTAQRSLIIDRQKEDEVAIGFETPVKTIPKGKFTLAIDGAVVTPATIPIPEEKTKMWKTQVNVAPQTLQGSFSGTLTYDGGTRFYEYPIALAYYNSQQSIVRGHVSSDTDSEFIEVDNGFLTFRGSQKYHGQVFYLSVESSENYLLTDFPEVKPFLWFNEFYGGIGTVLRPAYTNDMTDWNKVSFVAQNIERGLWKGIGFKSPILEYSPLIKGLQVTTNYLTLPEAPFLLVQQEITNHSGMKRQFFTSLQATFNPSGNADRYYTQSHGKIAMYQLQEYESAVGIDKDLYTQWTAYRNAQKEYLVAAILPQIQQKLTIRPYTPNLSVMYLTMSGDGISIAPGNTLTFNVLYLFTKNQKTINPFISSNLTDLLSGVNSS